MTRQGIGMQCLLAATAGGLLLATAGCGGSSKTTATTAVPTTTSAAPTTTTGSAPQPAACTTNCVVSDDNVQYDVTAARRFKDRFNEEDVAIGFTITNRSSQGVDFAPLDGGFSAVTSSGGVIGETYYIGQGSGDPRCYDNSSIDTNGTDAQTYHVNAGATFRMPKQVCMVVPAGQKITEIEFADNNATSNADVTLKPGA